MLFRSEQATAKPNVMQAVVGIVNFILFVLILAVIYSNLTAQKFYLYPRLHVLTFNFIFAVCEVLRKKKNAMT